MRRWSLALLVTLASPALAQAPEPAAADTAAAPTPAPAAPAAQEAPAPEVKAPPAAPTAEPQAPAAAPPAPTPEAKPAVAAPTPEAAPPPAAPTPAPAPVRAQKPPPPAPAPAPAPVMAAPAPVVAAPTVTQRQEEPTDEEQVRRKRVQSEARYIFENLLLGDTRSFAGELLYPFQLEDKRYGTAEELVVAWVKQLRQKRTDLISLYDIEVLPLAEMEKKYGKAPARLGLGPLKDADLYAAVGNLSGRAAVLLFRAPKGVTPRAFAYTD